MPTKVGEALEVPKVDPPLVVHSQSFEALTKEITGVGAPVPAYAQEEPVPLVNRGKAPEEGAFEPFTNIPGAAGFSIKEQMRRT